MTPENRRELQQLLSALCDNDLNEAGHARLVHSLEGDAECRRLYLEYIDMHARLLTHPGLGADVTIPAGEAGAGLSLAHYLEQAGVTPPLPARPGRSALRYGLVAAATLAATLLVQIFWWAARAPDDERPQTQAAAAFGTKAMPIATLTQAANCVWKTPEPGFVGARLLPGELYLQRGVARIRFDSGPELVVEGPAHLRLNSSTAATVLRGKVVFRADETAPPFDLHTPSSTLVDLGTEYAVAVAPEGEEIHVFDGEVQRTPKAGGSGAEPEHLKAGEARRYGHSPVAPGQPTALDPKRFVRRVEEGRAPLDPAAGLLAYEGFNYPDPKLFQDGQANGGFGWSGPWVAGFARPLNDGDHNLRTLNPRESLVRPGAAQPSLGGCFDYTGFTKYYRRLDNPVRLDIDATYYLSFLFRRHGPPKDEVNAVALLLWTTDDYQRQLEDRRQRLNIGVRGTNQLFTHLVGISSVTPLPLSFGETYLLVAKIVASASNPDQVFMRVYGPEEPVEREESGSWSVIGPPFQSDLVFEWLQLHINSKTRQIIDEVRLGSSWSSVTAPWIGTSFFKKGGI